jgi:short-subunit dehydrogenase
LPELLRSRGHALLIASLATFVPLPGAGGYSPSKAGVESLAGMLQVELAHAGVTVGTAHPCWIDTGMVRAAEAAMPTFRELRNDLPWPARSTTSPEICAAALADGIERRARKVYIPRSVALIAALRSLLNSSLGGRMAVRMAAGRMPQLDREVMAACGVEHVQPHVQPQVGSAS